MRVATVVLVFLPALLVRLLLVAVVGVEAAQLLADRQQQAVVLGVAVLIMVLPVL
jgi:hypothetical protein